MHIADMYNSDVLIGIGLMGFVGGLLCGKNGGTRLFAMLIAWVILMMVWPVVFTVMYVMANVGAEIFTTIAKEDVSATGRAVIGKGLAFGLMLAIYGKLVWEEMHSPASPRGAYVAGSPRSPFTKRLWR